MVAAALLVPIQAAPVRANHTSDAFGPCLEDNANRFAGDKAGTATINKTGVIAAINIPNDGTYRPCNDGLGNDGSFAWLALQHLGGAGGGDGWADIVQIGLAHCNNWIAFQGTCIGLHFFYAVGGCNGAAAGPLDLGPGDNGSHVYKVEINNVPGGLTVFQLFIDGVKKHERDLNHSSVACWAWGDREAVWAVEKWDAGDGVADPDGSPVWFTNAKFQNTRDGPYLSNTGTSNTRCPITNNGIAGKGLTDCWFGNNGGLDFYMWSQY